MCWSFFKKRLQCRCFAMSIAKFLTASYYDNSAIYFEEIYYTELRKSAKVSWIKSF